MGQNNKQLPFRIFNFDRCCLFKALSFKFIWLIILSHQSYNSLIQEQMIYMRSQYLHRSFHPGNVSVKKQRSEFVLGRLIPLSLNQIIQSSKILSVFIRNFKFSSMYCEIQVLPLKFREISYTFESACIEITYKHDLLFEISLL